MMPRQIWKRGDSRRTSKCACSPGRCYASQPATAAPTTCSYSSPAIYNAGGGGFGKSTKTRGQTTDNNELDKDTSLEVGAVQKIFDLMLVFKNFKHNGIVVYVDKAFGSTCLCNWADGLGILIVAMTKGGQPKVMNLSANNYWKFRRTTTLDEALQ